MSIYHHGRRRRHGQLRERLVDAYIGVSIGIILAFVLYLLTLVVMSL